MLRRLDRAGAGRLVVVTAPPGYGKTTLLADWLRSPDGRPSAWVGVEAGDDAPRLRAALLAALRAVPGLPPAGPLQAVGAGGGAGPPERGPIGELVAALDATHPGIRLVLDDVDELTDPEALRDLSRLVRGRPAGLRLVLSGRTDPPLPLARMRLEGRLHELRAEDLRLDLDGAAALLGAAGTALTPAQVATLHARTGGWAAGLRLAARALRGRDDPAAFVAQFSGSEGAVADYLTDEVLAVLPEETRRLLLSCAVCPQLPAGLATALSGRADAERVLADLTRVTALVERVEPRTYRVHTLLRTCLAAELERHFPTLRRRSDATAARWWLTAGEPEHALRHAERSGDAGLVLEILRAGGDRLVATGRLSVVRRALAACDPATGDPTAGTVGTVGTAGRAAPGAAPVPGPGGPGGRHVRVPPEREALQRLSSIAALVRAETAVPGDGVAARLAELAMFAREHGFPYVEGQALSLLAGVEAMRGEYRSMSVTAAAAVAAAATVDDDAAARSPRAAGLLAYGDLLAGDPGSASARAREVPAAPGWPAPADDPVARVVRRVADADLAGPTGRRGPGRPAEVGDAALPVALLAALALLEHPVDLAQGGPRQAAETAARLGRRAGDVGELRLMDAWVHLHAGRPDAARTAVDPLTDGSVATLVPYTLLEAHLVRTEAALRGGDPVTARTELDAALARGAALRILRPFLRTGALTRELLGTGPTAGTDAEFAGRLAAALPGGRAVSERELVVLVLLPSLLTTREIAAELTVSVNTVKSHIRSIYVKLGVATRRDAIRRAHELGLLAGGAFTPTR
ncbi:LuxR family transcriptional regulator, maltose regulon positive regulatory protein [Pseudonocardia ammonioxydans]|uniref:LuxR family transcriptional regulator, maltose regulon positive regulatory protein n=1 Tax=Pseudonocardia ammonioxydans TaxID=260086 RepID=A0A1I4X349_PSUAM|nr:LuxR family transcriptional regulator, maltose regulon positive regulatory protein [Pseudonocardia ammonioxydans]